MVHHHSGDKSIQNVKQGVVLKHPVDTGCRFKNNNVTAVWCMQKVQLYRVLKFS